MIIPVFLRNMVHMGKQLTNSFMIDPSIHLPPVLLMAGHSSEDVSVSWVGSDNVKQS